MPILDEVKHQVDALTKQLKVHSIFWKIAAAVAILLALALVLTLLHKPAVDGKVQQMDSTIVWQQRTIDALQAHQITQDSIIAANARKIALSKTQQNVIIHQYEKIPADVHALDREQLRREVSEY